MWTRPTLTELRDRVEAGVRAELGVGPLLRRGILKAVTLGLAGALHELHGHQAWLARQAFPDTAEGAELEHWADRWGMTRKQAEYATGTVEFAGVDGASIAPGVQVRRSDGRIYVTTGSGTIASGVASVAVQAMEAGAAGDLAAESALTLVNPLDGITGAEVEEPGLAGGADQETDTALRDRLLARLAAPPQGGAIADYVRWAVEVPGVTRAWCIPQNQGAGTVGVTFAVDADPDGPIPDAGQVATVQAYLEERRPVTAEVTAFAPAAVALNPSITLTPNGDVEVQARIKAALEDLLLREAAPGSILLVSHIREAISNAAGEADHVLNSPSGNVVYDTGELGVLGTITWP